MPHNTFIVLLINCLKRISVSGRHFEVSLSRRLLARIISTIKVILIACLVLKVDLIVPQLRLLANNRVQSCLGLWLASNMIESQLLSSGAFEVFCQGMSDVITQSHD